MKTVLAFSLLFGLGGASATFAATMQVDGALVVTLDSVTNLTTGLEGSLRPITSVDFSPVETVSGDGVASVSGSIGPDDTALDLNDSVTAIASHTASSTSGGFARAQNTSGGAIILRNQTGLEAFRMQFSWSYLLNATLTADALSGETGITQLSLFLSSETASENLHVNLLEQLRETSPLSSQTFADSGVFTVDVAAGSLNVVELSLDVSGQVTSQEVVDPNPSPVPLPGSIGLLLASLLGLRGVIWSRHRFGMGAFRKIEG